MPTPEPPEKKSTTEDDSSGTGFGKHGDNYHGAFLWSGMHPEDDLPIYLRIVLLPIYLSLHAYHCIKGTPVHVEYGDHESRYSKGTHEKDPKNKLWVYLKDKRDH